MRRTRRFAVAGSLALAAVLGMGSLAWACVYADGPYVTDPQPNKAPAGSEVTVGGGQWATDGQVNVGWSSDGRQVSQQLATAFTDAKGSFQARVRVPEAASGVHYLVVSQGRVSKATAFEVTSPARSTSPSSDPANSGGTDTSAGTSPAGESRTGSQPSGTSNTGASGGTQGSAPAGGFPGEPAPQADRAPAVNAAPTRATSGPLAGRTATAPAGSTSSPGAVATADDDGMVVPQPSAGSAFNDAWPAFQGGSSFRDAVRIPTTEGQGSSSATAVGLLGLTLGLMALSAGFGFAEASRRRALVER